MNWLIGAIAAAAVGAILTAVIALARRDGAAAARIDQANLERAAAERIADAEARSPRTPAALAQRLRDGGQL